MTEPKAETKAAEARAEKHSEDEIQKLRDQIDDLTAKLEAKQDAKQERQRHVRQGERDERDDLARDLPGRIQDEAGRLTRGLTHAYLEQVRQGVAILDAFVDEVFPMTLGMDDDYGTGRSSRRTTRTVADDDVDTAKTSKNYRNQSTAQSVSDMSGDLYGGVLRAVNRSLSIPRKGVDRFYETYHERDRGSSNP